LEVQLPEATAVPMPAERGFPTDLYGVLSRVWHNRHRCRSAEQPTLRNRITQHFASWNTAKLRFVMTTSQQKLVEQIHAAAKPLLLAITGGGSGAIAALLEVPGGSATLLEAVVPYASTALEQWLGGRVDHYCSERTARAMAMSAFVRAQALTSSNPHKLLGIGATASLASNRPKRGPHRIHVAWQSTQNTTAISCDLLKGARTRADEEHVATTLILNAIADACGVHSALQVETDPKEPVVRRTHHAPSAWTELLLGERSHVVVPEILTDEALRVIFPGAFNPIHTAHRRMAKIAAERLGKPVTFELSITNVDKAPLDFLEIADRLNQFEGERVLLSRAPRFIDKAQLAPGCTFVVGVDTITRIADAKYYPGGVAQRDAAIAALTAARCRFLVFGRCVDSSFRSLSTVSIPPELRELCDEVSESEFREDISSTELRGM
jgi:nicotinamide mononucleotide (NMN) deamidase PncC